jgi:uncharacterized protein
MDGTVLQIGLFLAATFAASLVAGVSGFAFGLLAAAVWLHVLTPLQTATLIVCYGLIVQGYAVWKLRGAVRWQRLWPFVLGGAPGVLIGVLVLRWANPSYVRAAIGAFLLLYAIYALTRPKLPEVRAGPAADAAVGLASGMLGAMTGFAGILVVIWSGLRGWSKDEQRAVFQPVGVALFAMSVLAFGVTGSIATDTAYLFLMGLPLLALGTWAGFMLYGRLDEAGFRRTVLILLLASGALLIGTIR